MGGHGWNGMRDYIYIYETGWEKMRGDWTQGRI